MEGHLEKLRKAEIDAVRRWLRPGLRVLEIGGGSGYQASLIASLGCDVLSIDLAGRPAPRQRFYPVQDYDGRNVPAADASVDLVFSSNVLEHIRPLSPILGETRRVLKPDGLAIHIVPSAAWRFWTCGAYYGFVLKCLTGLQRTIAGMVEVTSLPRAIQERGLVDLARRILPWSPHGEYPNAIAELYYFSRGRWSRVFERNRFDVMEATGNDLFYTGYALFPALSLRARRRLARFLGSACHIFVTRPAHMVKQ